MWRTPKEVNQIATLRLIPPSHKLDIYRLTSQGFNCLPDLNLQPPVSKKEWLMVIYQYLHLPPPAISR